MFTGSVILFSLTLSTRSRTREEVLSKGDEGIFLFFEAGVSDASAPRFSAGISVSRLSPHHRLCGKVGDGGDVGILPKTPIVYTLPNNCPLGNVQDPPQAPENFGAGYLTVVALHAELVFPDIW